MYTALITSVLLAGYWVAVNGTFFKYYNSKIGFRNRRIRANYRWLHGYVPSLLKCAVECYADLNCRTFSFSRSKKTCHGYTEALGAYKNNMVEAETILFQTSRGYIGSSCSKRDECNFQKSVCSFDVCLCSIGLYYSPKHNSCKRKCPEYGEEMDVYKQRSIKGHNTIWIIGLTLAACCQRCVDEASYICLTIEYNEAGDGGCGLSTKGYMDVAVQYREQDPGYLLGQRRCK